MVARQKRDATIAARPCAQSTSNVVSCAVGLSVSPVCPSMKPSIRSSYTEVISRMRQRRKPPKAPHRCALHLPAPEKGGPDRSEAEAERMELLPETGLCQVKFQLEHVNHSSTSPWDITPESGMLRLIPANFISSFVLAQREMEKRRSPLV